MSLPVLDQPPSSVAPAACGPFDSAKTLLAEASASVDEFRTACDAFVREAACTQVSVKQPRTGHEQIKVAVRQQPPTRLRTLAFTVTYKLRRALDQAAIAGSVELGCAGRSGGFPFGASAGAFELIVARDCADYDARLVAHFRALKPYGGEDGDALLCTLGSMAGAQRNQLSVGLGLDAARIKVESLLGALTGEGEVGNFGWDRKKRELHVATLTAEDATVETLVTARTRLPLVVELGGATVFEDREAGDVLAELLARVEGIVHGIERETALLKTDTTRCD